MNAFGLVSRWRIKGGIKQYFTNPSSMQGNRVNIIRSEEEKYLDILLLPLTWERFSWAGTNSSKFPLKSFSCGPGIEHKIDLERPLVLEASHYLAS